MKFLVVAVLLAVSGTALAAPKACGSDPMTDVDEMLAKLIPFGNPNVKLPTKPTDLPAFCSFYRNGMIQLADYNRRCVKGGQRNTIQSVLENIRRFSGAVCTEGTEVTPQKQAFLGLSGCVRSAGNQLRQCIVGSKNKLASIPNAAQSARLPLLCCEWEKYKNCVFETLTAQPGCSSPSASQAIGGFVSNFGATSVAQACGSFDTQTQCQGLSYPANRRGSVPKSFLVAVVNGLNSL